jgi:TatD DNase family protein
MLVDSHCHLDFPVLANDRTAVLRRAREAGVRRMVTISTTKKEFATVLATAEALDDVYCSVGIHPNHVHEDGENLSTADLVALAAHPKVVGIGETGFDYHYNRDKQIVQEKNFRQHIQAAISTDLPIIIHSRDAEHDTAKILRAEGAGQGTPIKGVMHCFSSRRVLAEDALDIGFYISFSGILTFKKSHELRDIAKIVPLDRLLVETDSPYLAPEPYRGRPCEPAYVVHTARVLAEIMGITPEEIADRTTENFFRLFSKVPRPT